MNHDPSRRSTLLGRTVALAASVLLLLGAAPGALATTEPAGDDAQGEVTAELPPPDLPTSNQQGYTFDLDAQLKTDLDALPKEAPVYELQRTPPTKEDAQSLADRLGIGAEVQDQGNGVFEATGTGQVFVSPDVVQYFSLERVRDGELPDDKAAVAFAREWLRLTGLLPPDLGESKVVGRFDDSRRVVVQFFPEEPKGILSAYPSITVALGPTGTILEVSLRWADIKRVDVYLLRPARDAWNEVESGQAFLEVSLPEDDLEPGTEVKGSVAYSGVEVVYTTAGPPGGRQFLSPVYVFSGRIKPEGAEKSYPIRAYVAALANSGAPVG